MSHTRQQLDDLVKAQMDAQGSYRFEATLLRATMDAVFSRGWRKILNANRNYRLAKRTVTTDALGQVAIADLDSGSGTSAERFYRVLTAAKGSILYYEAEFLDQPLAATVQATAPFNRFYRSGAVIQFLPANSGDEIDVWVNHTPQKPSELGAGDTVVWPEDYEMIVVYETAARLAAKGAAETDGTTWYQELADDLWRDLLADVARFTTNPIVMGASDEPTDWGGQ